MVYPAYLLEFKIGTAGRESTSTDMKTIKDVETFEPAFDNGVEEWNPYDAEGWVRRLMTAKSFSVSLSGKRNVGDAGNDYIAEKAMLNGLDVNSVAELVFPNGDKLKWDCVINTSNIGGGDATSVSGLESELMSDGKPEYIAATP